MAYNPIAPPTKRSDQEEEMRYQVRVVLYFARMAVFALVGLTALLWAIGAHYPFGTALLMLGSAVSVAVASLVIWRAWVAATKPRGIYEIGLEPFEFWYVVALTIIAGLIVTFGLLAAAVTAGWGA